MHNLFRRTAVLMVAFGLAAIACSSSSGSGTSSDAGTDSGANPVTQTGQSCTDVNQCYPGFLDAGLDASAISGVTCLTQLQGGYCTHTCSTDSDCCSVAGECPNHFKEVCASFESTGNKYCFLSCDPADLASDPDSGSFDPDSGKIDSTLFCQTWANSNFTCRSTGGGSENRLFCGP